jgi:hypothetical protein
MPIDSNAAREAAAARLVEARARLAEEAAERYAAGPRLARRDSDRLEQIARLIVGAVEDFEIEFDRLDVARDLCAYFAADGRRIERSAWRGRDIALSIAEVFEPVLNPAACAVLTAAVRTESPP